MKIINNFFINRKLKSISHKSKILNIPEELKSPSKIFLLYNEKFDAIEHFLTIKETIKNNFPQSDIYYMIFDFFNLYKEIDSKNLYKVRIPTPIKFIELEDFYKLKKQHNVIDLFIDFSTIDNRYRRMIKRILNPQISISDYNDKFVDDYNILVKSHNDSIQLMKMLNYTIKEKSTLNYIKVKMKKTSTEQFDYVFIGNSFSIKQKIKRAVKENKTYLHIDNIFSKINLFHIKAILYAKETFYENKYTSFIAYLEKIKDDSII